MNEDQIRNIVEAALMTAGRPLSIDALLSLFGDEIRPERAQVRAALNSLGEQYRERGIELKEVASGFRIQVRAEMSDWMSRLWQERPPRYSRALLETLSLIAYRQPITRGEIEDVRGVAVSTNIIRTIMERGWARVVGHRDVPGKPEMFGTTREFLDYFGLKSLDELPSLAELRDLDKLNVELDFGFDLPPQAPVVNGDETADDDPDDDSDDEQQSASVEGLDNSGIETPADATESTVGARVEAEDSDVQADSEANSEADVSDRDRSGAGSG
ncbi:MAG: SMC-Scp complex subunit ScpB [Gammaproteobacteria bacterium]